MVEDDYRQWAYPHNPGFVTTIGGDGSTFVPSFTARDTDNDVRLGIKVAAPRIYIGVGYLSRAENYGYPRQNGVGFGAEKLPDLDQPFSIYGSIWYYPTVSGDFDTAKLEARFLKYQVGGTAMLGGSGLFLDLGFLGDSITNKQFMPGNAAHAGGYAGLGIKF
jgi:hypothetical protein